MQSPTGIEKTKKKTDASSPPKIKIDYKQEVERLTSVTQRHDSVLVTNLINTLIQSVLIV